jgi:hypothetical protein
VSEAEQEAAGGEADEEAIRRRAYELHESGEGGSAEDNWLRAEGELRGPAAPQDE